MRTLNEIIPLIHRGRERIARADVETAFDWIADLLDQVEARHRRGDLHGEIGPRAITVAGRQAILLEPGGPVAPPEYRDPEAERGVFRGDDTRARVDVYGIGATLYALLEGGAPPCGARSPFTRPVPPAAAWIASRAMAEGTARFPTARAMRVDVDRLRRLIASRDPYDVSPSELPSYDGGEAPAGAATPLRSFRPAAVGRRRRRWRVIALGAIVLLLAASGLWERGNGAPGSDAPNHATPGPGTPPTVAMLIETWSAEIDQRLGASGEWFRPGEVPLLVVEDGASMSARDLEGWTRMPSRALTDRMREILREEPSAAQVERRLGELLPDRTRPAVLRVSPGAEPGTIAVRFLYRGLGFEDTARE